MKERNVKRKVLLLLFVGLAVSSMALPEAAPVVSFALMVALQNIRGSAAQPHGLAQLEVQSYVQHPHFLFFTSTATTPTPTSKFSKPKSQKCMHLENLLEPMVEKDYIDSLSVTNNKSDESPGKGGVLEKYKQMLSMARAEGGSTREMVDLLVGKPYLPAIGISFAEDETEYEDQQSVALYRSSEHKLVFSPLIKNFAATDAYRVFIHEAVHGTQVLKSWKAFSPAYLAKKTLLDQEENRRFSSIYQVTGTSERIHLKMQEHKLFYPYFGEKEKYIFDTEYASCTNILNSVAKAIITGADLSLMQVEVAPGLEISMEEVLNFYEQNHVEAPTFMLGPFNRKEHAPTIKEYRQMLKENASFRLPLPFGSVKYWVIGKSVMETGNAQEVAFLVSFENIKHHFVATLFQHNLSLEAYQQEDPKLVDSEKISHLKEYYKNKFIAQIRPRLEEFFLQTNRRFKEDLIEACETENNPTEMSLTF